MWCRKKGEKKNNDKTDSMNPLSVDENGQKMQHKIYVFNPMYLFSIQIACMYITMTKPIA